MTRLEIALNHIDELIDEWHDPATITDKSLHDYVAFTWDEWSAFMKDAKALPEWFIEKANAQ